MVKIFTRRLKVSNNDEWKDQLDIYSTIDSDYIIDTSNISTTMNDTNTISSWSSDTITIGNNPNTTFTISGDNALKFDDNDITFTTHEPIDFVDNLPTLNKIQAMCAEYPGLSKAFDNFKVTYKMVHQDWLGKKKVND